MPANKNSFYTWFVEPLDARTNAIIAEEKSDYELMEIICEGVPRKLVSVPHHIVRVLEASRLHTGLDFNVFVRQEPRGPLRRWRFERQFYFRPTDREEVRV